MAKSNSTAAAKFANDGRKVAILLLKRADKIKMNDIAKLRAVVQTATRTAGALSQNELARFSAVIADFLGSALDGCVMDSDAYDQGRPDAMAMRLCPKQKSDRLAQASGKAVRHG